MKMKVLVLSIVLCCVSAGAFLVQTQPLHQSTPGQQSLQILTKTLLSLTNHSGKAKSNIYTELKLKTLMRKDGINVFFALISCGGGDLPSLPYSDHSPPWRMSAVLQLLPDVHLCPCPSGTAHGGVYLSRPVF